MSEEALGGAFDALFAAAPDTHRVVFNAHVPPFDTGLDEAPMLDAKLTVTPAGGQVKLGPVGSTAVRAAIERYRPLAACTDTSTSLRAFDASVTPWRSIRAATTAPERSTACWSRCPRTS